MTTAKGIRGKRDEGRPTRCTSADRTLETKAEGVLGIYVETSQDVLYWNRASSRGREKCTQ